MAQFYLHTAPSRKSSESLLLQEILEKDFGTGTRNINRKGMKGPREQVQIFLEALHKWVYDRLGGQGHQVR